jgi:Na+-transporting NADH:ubiquinone oxidoreductase subunit C
VADFNRESLSNVVIMALAVCLVCSIIVSGAAVVLKPAQLENKALDVKKNILRAAGMLPGDGVVDDQGRGVAELFAEFTVRAVDLDTGEYVDGIDFDTYEPIRAAKDPDASTELAGDQDIAVIGRRENVSLVYIREIDGSIDKVVIPVRGYGLWGTLFGYLGLEGDLRTVAGLGFYEHKETPGLGGEVDNANWKSTWPGVKLFDEEGNVALRLVKQRSAQGSAAADHEIDALSGATFTTRGVQNLVQFWTGDMGFGPFLQNLKT